MSRAGRAHALLHAPERLATQAQRKGLVLLAVGGGAGAVEDPVAGRLDQQDLVVLAEFREALDGALLGAQALRLDLLGLEPVVVGGEVDHRVGARFVQQGGEAGGIPALLGWSGREETDVFLRP